MMTAVDGGQPCDVPDYQREGIEGSSSFHVVDYNSTTGEVISRHTSQGYADNSTWSRGQAWGIYGFANSQFICSSNSCAISDLRCSVPSHVEHELPQHLAPHGLVLH